MILDTLYVYGILVDCSNIFWSDLQKRRLKMPALSATCNGRNITRLEELNEAGLAYPFGSLARLSRPKKGTEDDNRTQKGIAPGLLSSDDPLFSYLTKNQYMQEKFQYFAPQLLSSLAQLECQYSCNQNKTSPTNCKAFQ